MKSKNIITGVGMLFCLAFFNVQDAAGQRRDWEYEEKQRDMKAIVKGECDYIRHPSYVSYCWEQKIRNGGGDKKFYGAKLSRMDLYRANLTEARLFNADLYNADLTGANLTGAILTNARLDGAILTGAIVSRSKTKGIDFEDWKRRGAIVRD